MAAGYVVPMSCSTSLAANWLSSFDARTPMVRVTFDETAMSAASDDKRPVTRNNLPDESHLDS